MRIILKPGGLIVVLGALSTLVALAVFRVGKTNATESFARKGITLPFAPDEAIPLIENGDFSQSLTARWNFTGVPTIVKKAGPDGTQQYFHEQVVPGANAWSTSLGQVITKPLKTGDRVVFRGWFRSPESMPIHFYIEETPSPHGKTVSEHLDLTPEWKEVSVVGTIKRDFVPGEAQLMLHFGAVRGAIDMANFRLENYGPVTPSVSASPSATAEKQVPKTEGH